MKKSVYVLIEKFNQLPTYVCDARHYYMLEDIVNKEAEKYRNQEMSRLESEIKSERYNLDDLKCRDAKAKEHRIRWQNRLNGLNEKYKREGATLEEKKSLKKEYKRFEAEAGKEREAVRKSEKKIEQLEDELQELMLKSLEDIVEDNPDYFSVIREIPMNENLKALGYYSWKQEPERCEDECYEDWEDE